MEYLRIRNQLRNDWFLSRINNWFEDDEPITESAFANMDINIMITLETCGNLGGENNEK